MLCPVKPAYFQILLLLLQAFLPLSWIQVSLKDILRRDIQREQKAMWKRMQRWELHSHKPKYLWSDQKLEEARKNSPLEPSKGVWHLDFGPLPSRTVSELVSISLRHPVHGICYSSLRRRHKIQWPSSKIKFGRIWALILISFL